MKHVWQALSGIILAAVGTTASAPSARAQVLPPPGFIYDSQPLGSTTQSCVAVGPGGTFVGIGPGFTANAQVVVFARESGDARLVAFGFNSIADCAYDRGSDVLYVSDNADAAELPGAVTGDTVFAIPSASTATGLTAHGLELVPSDALPFAAGMTVDTHGNLLVSNAAGGGAGTIVKIDIDGTPPATTFAAGLDFAGGLAVNRDTGELFAAETRQTFDAQIRRFDAFGTERPVFAGPSTGFGSVDLAFDTTGRLLATGLFLGDVVAFDTAGAATPFVTGLTFASGISVNDFTGRIEILSSFSGTDEDRSIHRFIPVDRLEPGRGRKATQCAHEFYGLALTAARPGNAARKAVCRDGDLCDADGQLNDRCLFPVGFCLNVDDPRTPECQPDSQILNATVSTTPFSPSVARAGEALAAALPVTRTTCVFSDGLVVPVRHTKQGRKAGTGRIKVEVQLASGKKDTDRIPVVCEPAP